MEDKNRPFGDFIEPVGEIDFDNTNETVTGADDFVELANGNDEFLSVTDLKIDGINVKFNGLMPEHEKEAIEMAIAGVPLGEIADHFGMARSDIAYMNKSK